MGQQPCCEREDHCWVTWLHWSLAGIALAVRVEESGIAPLNALDTLLGGLFAMWGQTSETWLVLLLGLKDQHRPLLKFKLSIVDVDAVFLVLFKVWIFIMTSPFLWASNLFLGLQIQQAFQVQAITHCCWRFGAPRSPQPKVRSHPNLAPLTEEGFRMACRCWQGVDAERPTPRFQPYLKERAVCPKWVSFLWIIVQHFDGIYIYIYLCIFWSSQLAFLFGLEVRFNVAMSWPQTKTAWWAGRGCGQGPLRTERLLATVSRSGRWHGASL